MTIKLDKVRIMLTMAERGYSNVKLAELTGIGKQNISTLLNRGTCRAETAMRLAKALKVDPETIVRKED